jgi:rhodanese-related sulfurtransferase
MKMTQLQEEILPQTLKELRDARANFTLVDVRDPWELEICRIEGSINFPLPQLTIQTPELDKDAPIVLYCHHGIRSRNAVLILQQKGFRNVSSLKGGIDAWSQQIDANVPVY